MNLHTICVFIAQSMVAVGALAACGYPIARLIRRLGGERSVVVASPLLGIFVLAEICWLWSDFVDRGIGLVIPSVVAVGGVASLVLWVTDLRRRGLGLRSLRHALSRVWWLVPFVVLTGAYVVIYHAYFALSYQTPATLRNFDEPHFAVLAEYIRHFGFSSTGNVVGTHLGVYTHNDVYGTFVLNLTPAALLDKPVWSTQNSVLFCGWLLLAWQLTIFVRRGLRRGRAFAIAASIAAAVSPVVVYVMGNGYISQLYGTALLSGGLSVLCSMSLHRRGIAAGIVQLGVVSAALWHVYPFAAFVIPVIGIPLRLALTGRHDLVRSGLPLVGAAACGLVVSALLAVGRFTTGLDQAIGQGSARAGWPLPAFAPQEIVGFTSSYAAFNGGNTRWLGGAFLLLVVAGAAMLTRRMRSTRVAVVGVAIGFASYAAIYLKSGVSYQQWKWAAFVAPMLVVCSLSIVTSALRSLPRWKALGRPIVMVGVVAVIGIAFLINSVRMTDDSFRLDNPSSFISPEIAALAGNDQIDDLEGLAVRIKTWDAMWVTSFEPRTPMYHFGFWGYYPVERVAAGDVLMLERSDDALPDSRVLERTKLTDTYSLVRVAPDAGATVEVLDHTGRAKEGQEIHWRVRVTNTGPAAWTSPVDDARSGMTLRISFTGSTSAHIDDYASVSLPRGEVVEPGGSRLFEGVTVNPSPSNFALQFAPVIGGDVLDVWTASTLAPVIVNEQTR